MTRLRNMFQIGSVHKESECNFSHSRRCSHEGAQASPLKVSDGCGRRDRRRAGRGAIPNVGRRTDSAVGALPGLALRARMPAECPLPAARSSRRGEAPVGAVRQGHFPRGFPRVGANREKPLGKSPCRTRRETESGKAPVGRRGKATVGGPRGFGSEPAPRRAAATPLRPQPAGPDRTARRSGKHPKHPTNFAESPFQDENCRLLVAQYTANGPSRRFLFGPGDRTGKAAGTRRNLSEISIAFSEVTGGHGRSRESHGVGAGADMPTETRSCSANLSEHKNRTK